MITININNVESRYDYDQEVYYVNYDDNCPAARTCRWGKGRILAINVLTIKESSNEEPRAIVSSYRSNVIREGDGWFKPHELYPTQEEVELDVIWHPVEDFTDEEWMQALGYRLTEADQKLEQLKWESELKREWKRGPNLAPIIDLEDAELGPCCCLVSEIRDLLYKCRENEGLIRRDVNLIANHLICHGAGDLKDDGTILYKIYNQLGIQHMLGQVR